MALKLITPPVTEPIGISDAMNYCRIDTDADVITIQTMITAARQEAEKITRRQLITATWELRLDRFPETIYLPMAPLQSVASLKYLDSAGDEQTLVENTDFIVDTYSEPARITPAYGMTWPPIYPIFNAVRVQYIAGYGDDDTDVPQSIRNWMMVFFGSLYEHRETDIVSNIAQAYTHLTFLDGLLDDFRVWPMESCE
jgi:uncharacterized phiE125 gp8 family phage protein